jgi:hypothetical protein
MIRSLQAFWLSRIARRAGVRMHRKLVAQTIAFHGTGSDRLLRCVHTQSQSDKYGLHRSHAMVQLERTHL